MNVRWDIGQSVWWARFESNEDWLICPDCGGEARIRVVLHDGTQISIECEGCRRGYEQATGYVRVYARQPTATKTTIIGFEVHNDKVEWQLPDSYRVPDDVLFDNEAEAVTRAQEIADKASTEERERINHKEKPTRSWAWLVHYHRKAIREAERQIAYHTSRLNVARVNAKIDNTTRTIEGAMR